MKFDLYLLQANTISELAITTTTLATITTIATIAGNSQ